MLGRRLSQRVRIRLPREAQFIPETNANKYALNVRVKVFDQESHRRLEESDVAFELRFFSL